MARKPIKPAKKTSAKSQERKLTPKQQLFVKEYLIDFNATRAAKAAGFSAKTADKQGWQQLANPRVAAEIEKLKSARAEKLDITADRILLELARLAFLDIGKAFTEGGQLKPLHEMDEDTRRAISGLEVSALYADGENIGRLSKIKLADKLSALEKLGKHAGIFDQKVTVDASGDTLSLLIQSVQGSSFKPVASLTGELEGGD